VNFTRKLHRKQLVNLTRKLHRKQVVILNKEKLHWKQLVGKTAPETTSDFNMENCTGNN